MPDPKQARELRRAVDRLNRCSIDDIEWIWSTFNDDQRRRLKPLLTAAGTKWKAILEDADAVAPLADAVAADMQRMTLLVDRLPFEVGKRVLACLDHPQRQAIADRLSPAKTAAAKSSDARQRMTERAKRSLHAAASTYASSMTVPAPAKRSAWPRFTRWMGRR